MDFYALLTFLFSALWVTVFIVVPTIIGISFYRKKRNDAANTANCSACKTPFTANDIVDENLSGDGIRNSGNTRKIIVTMRCSRCGKEKKFPIYTTYRHHPVKGSPAQQYFRELENLAWMQTDAQN